MKTPTTNTGSVIGPGKKNYCLFLSVLLLMTLPTLWVKGQVVELEKYNPTLTQQFIPGLQSDSMQIEVRLNWEGTLKSKLSGAEIDLQFTGNLPTSFLGKEIQISDVYGNTHFEYETNLIQLDNKSLRIQIAEPQERYFPSEGLLIKLTLAANHGAGLFQLSANTPSGIIIWENVSLKKDSQTPVQSLIIKAYPQPLTGWLQVDLEGINEAQICIYDQLGTLIHCTKDKQPLPAQIELPNLSPGFYILSMKTQEGKQYRKRLIKR